jgi:hypothetical protein
VPEGSHICYIFNDDEERYNTMVKYLQSGAENNDKALYLTDDLSKSDFITKMKQLGLEISNDRKDIVLSEAWLAYCPDGSFSVPDMLKHVEAFYHLAKGEKYDGARGTGEMSWALAEGVVKKGDLMEYEARLTQLLRKFPCTACCQYDARRFDGATILDVLKVHPMMVIRGQIYKNPYFIEPEVFLANMVR